MFTFITNTCNAILDKVVDVILPLDKFDIDWHEHEDIA